MTTHRFLIADVFTDRPFGGNQLAVLPAARGISDADMLTLAREFNFSETVFIGEPDAKAGVIPLRIFTPQRELPFAGHPTVGAAVALADENLIPMSGSETRITFREGIGDVPVTIRREAGRPTFAQLTTARLPEQGAPPPPVEVLAAMLGLSANDILHDATHRPEAHSCGVPFVFIPLRDRRAVARARLDLARWETAFRDAWACEIFIFSFDDGATGFDIHARMFAPSINIVEDAATGSACAALAGYLASRDPREDGPRTWRIAQGVEMGRPSRLLLQIDFRNNAVQAVRVGGHAVIVARGELTLPKGAPT